MTNPNPSGNYPVELKLKVAAIAQYLVGLILVAAVAGLTGGNLVADLPDWASALLAPVLPVLASFAAGYSARHQYRATEASPTARPLP
jgi:hypothetical protein